MNQTLQTEQEQYFHRREMTCICEIERQKGSKGWFMYAVYSAYAVLSDYGHSVARPVVCLVYLWLCGLLGMLACLVAEKTFWGYWEVLPQAAGWSFANIFPFFGFRGLYFGAEFINDLPTHLIVIGALQTVLGFICLFLLGLGLRSRFRLR